MVYWYRTRGGEQMFRSRQRKLAPEEVYAITKPFPAEATFDRKLLEKKSFPGNFKVLNGEEVEAVLRAIGKPGVTVTVHRLMAGRIILSSRASRRLREERNGYLEYPAEITPEMESEIVAACERKVERSFFTYCMEDHPILLLSIVLLPFIMWQLYAVYSPAAILPATIILSAVWVLFVGYKDKKRMFRASLNSIIGNF